MKTFRKIMVGTGGIAGAAAGTLVPTVLAATPAAAETTSTTMMCTTVGVTTGPSDAAGAASFLDCPYMQHVVRIVYKHNGEFKKGNVVGGPGPLWQQAPAGSQLVAACFVVFTGHAIEDQRTWTVANGWTMNNCPL